MADQIVYPTPMWCEACQKTTRAVADGRGWECEGCGTTHYLVVETAALADPDNPPLTEADFARMHLRRPRSP